MMAAAASMSFKQKFRYVPTFRLFEICVLAFQNALTFLFSKSAQQIKKKKKLGDPPTVEEERSEKKEHEKEEGGPERSPRPTSHGARANSKGKFPFSLVANSFFGALFYSIK